jgi:L-iditol 2-dehydrogenase
MKAMMLTGIRQMEMMEVPTPRVANDDDVLIKMNTIGVCGSDIHYYVRGKIGSQVVKYPYPVGHEGSGIVDKVGKKVKQVKPGDRIAIEPAMSCGECDQCKAGRPHTCRRLRFLGCPGQANGLLAEYLVMPEHCCIPISKKLSFDEAVISEPLAIGVYAVRQSVPMKGKTVGILGYGPIGMSVLLPAKARGASRIFVTDKLEYRLGYAKRDGAFRTFNPDKDDIAAKVKEAEPMLLDVVFECAGQQDAVNNALDILKPGGRLMLIGIPEEAQYVFSTDKMRHKEATIVNVRRQNNCTRNALAMMEKKIVDARPMATHRFKFADTKRAFDLVAGYRDGVMKAMIDFE